LSRHGARDPTAAKTAKYNATIAKIHKNVANFTGKYAFLGDYEYTLGADQLTDFGRQQMENSGTKYYQRYADLARKAVPFVRSSGEARVVESAEKWVDGFTQAKTGDRWANKQYPSVDVVISEAAGSNNTLNHDLCTTFDPIGTLQMLLKRHGSMSLFLPSRRESMPILLEQTLHRPRSST
jgi:uncharacterized glyoxalase superfamily metalloenzyme YdcJ